MARMLATGFNYVVYDALRFRAADVEGHQLLVAAFHLGLALHDVEAVSRTA